MFGLNLDLHSSLKVRGSEINFIKQKLLESKNPREFIISTSFKSFCNKSAKIFSSEQLLYNKVDFGASDFEAALQLQNKVKGKLLGRSVTLGPKPVEKHLTKGTLKNLTTPSLKSSKSKRISNFWQFKNFNGNAWPKTDHTM